MNHLKKYLNYFQTPKLNQIKLHKLKKEKKYKSLNNYMHVMQLNFFFTIILETKVSFSHTRQVAKWGFSCSVMLVILSYKLQWKS
jgi:hypothetical protein